MNHFMCQYGGGMLAIGLIWGTDRKVWKESPFLPVFLLPIAMVGAILAIMGVYA